MAAYDLKIYISANLSIMSKLNFKQLAIAICHLCEQSGSAYLRKCTEITEHRISYFWSSTNWPNVGIIKVRLRNNPWTYLQNVDNFLKAPFKHFNSPIACIGDLASLTLKVGPFRNKCKRNFGRRQQPSLLLADQNGAFLQYASIPAASVVYAMAWTVDNVRGQT